MQTAIAYNGTQVKQGGTKEDIKKGFKLWLDLVNPSPTEISEIKKTYDLDGSTLETLIHKSKKPQVRVLENHKFTIILDIRYKTFKNLITESIYLFHSTEWLITIHSENIDLMTNVQLLFEQKNKKTIKATIMCFLCN